MEDKMRLTPILDAYVCAVCDGDPDMCICEDDLDLGVYACSVCGDDPKFCICMEDDY